MLELRLLGPVEVLVDGEPVELAAKPRALIALLALSRNEVVPQDVLVERLWGGRPPERAQKALQVYVSQLRKELGAERLLTRAGGYALAATDAEVDAVRFERLVEEGRLEEALRLWRGPALADFRLDRWAAEAAQRLDDRRLVAQEARAELELARGRAEAARVELEELVVAHPHRERARGLLMLALYRSGRQAEALESYRAGRAALVEQLGIEPGRELQELERRILNHDLSLDGPGPVSGTVPDTAAAPAHGRRLRVVTAGGAVVAAAAVAAALLLSRGGGDAPLRSYVVKVENFLAQSRDGRTEVARAVAGASSCTIPARAAATSVARVQRNRQSLLQQLAALDVPSGSAALRSFDLLQRAAHASIAADWRYADWLRSRIGRPCVRGGVPEVARAADVRATALKRAFLAAFDPLARRFGKRVWREREF